MRSDQQLFQPSIAGGGEMLFIISDLGSHLGSILPPRDMSKYLKIYLVIITGEVLLASSEQRAGVLLKILWFIEQSFITKNYPAPNVNSSKLKTSLDKRFLKLNVHQNNLTGLLKYSILVLFPVFSDSLGLEWGLKMFLSNNFTGSTAACGPQLTPQKYTNQNSGLS